MYGKSNKSSLFCLFPESFRVETAWNMFLAVVAVRDLLFFTPHIDPLEQRLLSWHDLYVWSFVSGNQVRAWPKKEWFPFSEVHFSVQNECCVL